MEYGFVQIISSYLGVKEGEEYYNLPSEDPDLLKVIFEMSELVFRLKDSDIHPEKYHEIEEQQNERLRQRREFKDRINK